VRICVFCGSSAGKGSRYLAAATETGRRLVERGAGVVYGGGSVGCMGALADAALAAGGEVIGVIPEALAAREIAHRKLAELHVVGSMHERKALMAAHSDGFLALPGGFGTLEELFEVVTWRQLGYHRKPIALLNTGGYFDSLLRFCDEATAEEFVRERDRAALLCGDDIESVLDALFAQVGGQK
jgi:hypothetical protein